MSWRWGRNGRCLVRTLFADGWKSHCLSCSLLIGGISRIWRKLFGMTVWSDDILLFTIWSYPAVEMLASTEKADRNTALLGTRWKFVVYILPV